MTLPRTLRTLLFLAAVMASTMALAQDEKEALATELATLQIQREGPVLANQLTGQAIQPVVVHWSEEMEQSVSADMRPVVDEQMNNELERFSEAAHGVISAKLEHAAKASLVPLFAEKLSTEDMETIIAYLKSPASSKFRELGPDAATAWTTALIESTQDDIVAETRKFDERASDILAQAASGTPGAGDEP